MEDAYLGPAHLSSRTDLTDLADHHQLQSPTSTDGWSELEIGIHGDHDDDKDGWDDIEPLEEAKPHAALASIQAAQKQPVPMPKPQVPNLKPKSTLRGNDFHLMRYPAEELITGGETMKPGKYNDGDMWGDVADPAPKPTYKHSTAKTSKVVDDDDPWAAIAAPAPKSSSKPSADDDLWASIAAPAPTTGHKPFSSGRGRANKPAVPRLGSQRINRKLN